MSKSEVHTLAGGVKLRVTLTRWRRRLVAVEIWTPVAMGKRCSGGTCEPHQIHNYTIFKV